MTLQIRLPAEGESAACPASTRVEVRPVRQPDAAALVELRTRLALDSEFGLLEPGERPTTPAAERNLIRSVLTSANSTLVVAECSGTLAGYAAAYGGECRRRRHSARVAIGVLREFSGRGIGAALLAALDAWACAAGLHRLELTVMAHNDRAMNLYKRCGYFTEGVHKHALQLGAGFVDEHSMAKLL